MEITTRMILVTLTMISFVIPSISSSSLLIQQRGPTSRNGGLIVSFCFNILLVHHYVITSSNGLVSAERTRPRRNVYDRGLDEEEVPTNQMTNSPTIDRRAKEGTRKEKGVAGLPPTRPPSKGASPPSTNTDGVCLSSSTDPSIPSVTALEYLGMGYNLIEGNPRGSEITELDPGFRSGVILFEKSKQSVSLDNEISIPLGVELRYLTSCQFSSKSTELLDVSDYQRKLSRETRIKVGGGISGTIKGVTGAFDMSYSRSERFQSFQNDRTRKKNKEFESSAICTEFEGRLNSYYNHKTTETFTAAISTLTYPFIKEKKQIDAYKKFIVEYGTHYISTVVLGAKQIFTLVMESNAVSKLRQKQIDVSTTIGAKAMFSFSKAGSGEKKSGSVSNSGDNNNLINIVSPPSDTGDKQDSSDDSDGRRRLLLKLTGNVEKSTSTSDFERQLDDIRREVTEIKEVSIGGTVPSKDGDWRKWASSVRERPMPVVYDLEPLWNLMSEEMGKAFRDAINYIYNPDNNNDETESEKFRRAINLGVAAPNGDPISTYSFDRLSGLTSRTFLRKPSVENPFYLYDIQWKGSDRAVSAVFSNTIRDNIAPNEQEDKYELGFFDNRFSEQLSLKNSLKTFGISTEPGTATIGVYEDVDISSEDMLNSFTYLTADNVPENDKFVVGVVHPQGYIVNKQFGKDPGFRIEMRNDRDFRVIFTKGTNFTSPPTFIVSPMWFSEAGVFPQTSAEIQIGLTNCSISECEVQVGGVQISANRTTYKTRTKEFFTEAAKSFVKVVKDLNPLTPLVDEVIGAIIPGMSTDFFLPNLYLPFTNANKAITGFNPFVAVKELLGFKEGDSDFDPTILDKFTDQFLGFSFMAVDPSFDLLNLNSASDCDSTICDTGTNDTDTNEEDINIKMIHGVISIDFDLKNRTVLNQVNLTSCTGSGFTATAQFNKSPEFELFTSRSETDNFEGNEKITVTDQIVGGIRIEFDKEIEFLGIPTVFASPLTGTFQFGRSEVNDKLVVKTKKKFGFITTGTSTKTTTKKAELVGYPSVLIEHVTEHSTFIKAGIIHTMNVGAMLNGGEVTSIYEPVSFHFVAIGPVKRLNATDTFDD